MSPAAEPVAAAFRRPGTPARTRLIVTVAVLFVLAVVYLFRGVFGPLLAALAIAYVFEPMVASLEGRGRSRLVAVGLVFALGGMLAALLFVVTVMQGASLLEALLAENGLVSRSIAQWTALLQEHQHVLADLDLGAKVRDPEFWRPVVAPLAGSLKTILSGVLGWFEIVGALVLTPVYTFYLMLEMPRIRRFLFGHLPSVDRARTVAVLEEIHVGMSGFLRGRLTIAVAKGVLLSVGLMLCGTGYAWFVGMASGGLAILPLVGPLLGFLLAVGVALADSASVTDLLWIALVFGVAEGLENFVLTPWIMKGDVELHPLTVLFCVFFWGAALGAFGALLAIPLTLVVKILVRVYLLPHLERLAA